MAITLLCPKLTCRAMLRVPESVRGKRVRCPECGTALIVPLKTGPAPQQVSQVPKTNSPQR
jgi:hypothetical protein